MAQIADLKNSFLGFSTLCPRGPVAELNPV